MTIFLGFVLLCVISDVIGNSRSWWRITLGVVLAIVVACLMMLSYWDYRPTW